MIEEQPTIQEQPIQEKEFIKEPLPSINQKYMINQNIKMSIDELPKNSNTLSNEIPLPIKLNPKQNNDELNNNELNNNEFKNI